MSNDPIKSMRILIVDDQVQNIDILDDFLYFEGYTQVSSTTDPREVVDLLTGFNPDLILLDLMMPHLSGFDVLDQLKEILPAGTYLPILMLTADATKETRKLALSGGAMDFLTKPFDLDEVGLRVRNLLLTRFLHLQERLNNQILEEKVKERTAELEKSNSDLKQAKEKAEASDRLKSTFINNISHEIRTPLNGILGFGNLLADPDILPEEKAGYLSVMESSSDRLMNTISNFISISQITSGTQEVYLSNFPITRIINILESKFQDLCKSQNLDFTIDTTLADIDRLIRTDTDLLRKCISHLLDNAIKFTKNGSVKLAFQLDGQKLQCLVSDTGIGISPEAIKYIFKDFTQESNSNTRVYEGTGLGLSICKGFVELLGGTIHVESQKGVGSTFSFTIPV
jgi:signal transduction histidine kinase